MRYVIEHPNGDRFLQLPHHVETAIKWVHRVDATLYHSLNAVLRAADFVRQFSGSNIGYKLVEVPESSRRFYVVSQVEGPYLIFPLNSDRVEWGSLVAATNYETRSRAMRALEAVVRREPSMNSFRVIEVEIELTRSQE